MQEQNYSFEELKAELLERLEARGCTPITGYRYQCNWLKENGYDSDNKERGISFYRIITANMEATSITMP